MSRRVRRRLNNPLDQWTPATVAAAQANRPRTYGTRDFSSAARRDGREPLDATGQGFIYRYQLQGSVFENGFPGAMANYVSGSLNRATARGWTNDTWGRVVQTFRQAEARIVRRAKWRRIIRALRLRARDGHGLHTRTVIYEGGGRPRMWPQLRRMSQSTDAQLQAYAQRMGWPANWRPGLRGTGTQGFN